MLSTGVPQGNPRPRTGQEDRRPSPLNRSKIATMTRSLLLAALGSLLALPLAAQAPATYHGFTVHITLSPKALTLLSEKHETVIAAAYLSGNPRPDAPKRVQELEGGINLGDVKIEDSPGHDAVFAPFVLKSPDLKWVDTEGPQLNLNVFSGRRSSKNNLLDCEFHESTLQSAQDSTIPIACKLIGE